MRFLLDVYLGTDQQTICQLVVGIDPDFCSPSSCTARREFGPDAPDARSVGDPLYHNMAGHFGTSMAYMAACDLVFKGLSQPSGYTEPLLHAWRLKVKAAA